MAKTTGKIKGNLILVSMDGDQIGCTTGATFQLTNERIETTCKDNNGAKTYEAGSQDCSLQVEGIAKFDTVTNLSAIAAAAKQQTLVVWQFGGLDNADDPYWEFTGFISDFSHTGPLNAPSTWNFTAVPTSEAKLFNT